MREIDFVTPRMREFKHPYPELAGEENAMKYKAVIYLAGSAPPNPSSMSCVVRCRCQSCSMPVASGPTVQAPGPLPDAGELEQEI